MGSVNISLRKEAYEFLKSLKSRDASFSDVILEMKNKESEKGTGRSILKFAGVLKDKKDWKATEKRMKEFREDFNKHIEKTRKYMESSR